MALKDLWQWVKMPVSTAASAANELLALGLVYQLPRPAGPHLPSGLVCQPAHSSPGQQPAPGISRPVLLGLHVAYADFRATLRPP